MADKPGDQEVANYGAVESETVEKSLEELFEELGLGKAQVFCWATLALITYTDMSELVVISILVPYLRCEWELTILFETAISSSVFFFYGLGGLLFGSISDKMGRRSTLMVSLTILLIFGILSAVSTNKWMFLVVRSVVGLAIGANFPTCMVFSSEVACTLYKEYGVTIILVVANFGMFAVAVMGYFFLNLVGWRWFIIITTSPVVLAIICLTIIPESPRFLVASGRQAEAEKTIAQLFKWNGKTYPRNTTIKTYQNVERGDMSRILQPKYRKETVLLSVMYSGNILIIFGLIIFLPIALNTGFCGASDNKVPSHDCKRMEQKSLLSLSIITFSSCVACVVTIVLIRKIGRSIPMKVCAVVVLCLTCLLYVCVSNFFTQVVFFFIKCFTAAFNIIIWIIIPELYPTVIRNTATGFINCWGKFGGALGTALVYVLYYQNPYMVVTMFVVAALVSLVAAFIWNIETKDNVIEELISEDSEEHSVSE